MHKLTKTLGLIIFLAGFTVTGYASSAQEEAVTPKSQKYLPIPRDYLKNLTTFRNKIQQEVEASALTAAMKLMGVLQNDPHNPCQLLGILSQTMGIQAVSSFNWLDGRGNFEALLKNSFSNLKPKLTQAQQEVPPSSLSTLYALGEKLFIHYFDYLKTFHTLYHTKYQEGERIEEEVYQNTPIDQGLVKIFEHFFDAVLGKVKEGSRLIPLPLLKDPFTLEHLQEIKSLKSLPSIKDILLESCTSDSLMGDTSSIISLIEGGIKIFDDSLGVLESGTLDSSLHKLILNRAQEMLIDLTSLGASSLYRARYLPSFRPNIGELEGRPASLEGLYLHSLVDVHFFIFISEIHYLQNKFFQSIYGPSFTIGLKVYSNDRRDAANVFALAESYRNSMPPLATQVENFLRITLNLSIFSPEALEGLSLTAKRKDILARFKFEESDFLSSQHQEQILEGWRGVPHPNQQGLDLLSVLTHSLIFLDASIEELEKGRIDSLSLSHSTPTDEQHLWTLLQDHPFAHRDIREEQEFEVIEKDCYSTYKFLSQLLTRHHLRMVDSYLLHNLGKQQ